MSEIGHQHTQGYGFFNWVIQVMSFLSFGANSALKILPRYFLTVSYFITNGFELFVVCKRWTPNDSNLDGPKCPIQLLAFCTYFIG